MLRINDIKVFNAFTLAEMMVVMLIMSIALAAMAPVITTKAKSDRTRATNSSPWKWDNVRINTHFGAANSNHKAMLGQDTVNEETDTGKLIINTGDSGLSHILFKQEDNILGNLGLDDEYNLALGYNVLKSNGSSYPLLKSKQNIAIGYESLYGLQLSANHTGYNVAIGSRAGYSNIQGDDNIAIGYNTIYSGEGVQKSIAIGSNALRSLRWNHDNIALGYGALSDMTDGTKNIAIGQKALKSENNSTPYQITDNIAIGYEAMVKYGAGSHNVAIGTGTLYSSTSSNRNVAISPYALYSNTTGYDNIATGYGALYSNTTGYRNTTSGTFALGSNTTGYNNIVFGSEAMYYNQGGSNNIAIGQEALFSNISGLYNTAIGNAALYSNTSGRANHAIGDEALYNNTSGSFNNAMGHYALHNNTTGDSNTAIGHGAMRSNTTGTYNTAIGFVVMANNTTGRCNVAIGSDALYNNESGNYNTAIGFEAMHYNESGHNNTAIGYYALLKNTTGTCNTATGDSALGKNTSGYNNTAIGYRALYNNTSGSNNIAIGVNSLLRKDIKDYNIAIGFDAGPSKPESDTGGYRNIAIGYRACNDVSGSNKICIGNGSGVTNYGSGFNHSWLEDDVERVFIGSQSKFNGGIAVLEVHNDKRNVKVVNDGHHPNQVPYLNKSGVVINGNLYVKGAIFFAPINEGGFGNSHSPALLYDGDDPVNFASKTFDNNHRFATEFFSYKERGSMLWGGSTNTGYRNGNYDGFWPGEESTYNNFPSDRRLKYVGTEFKSGLDKIRQLKVFNYTFKKDEKKTPHVGIIAQDLQKIFPNAVTKGADGFLLIRMEDMFYALVNAVKELDEHLTRIENLVKQVQKDNAQLKKENKELKARLDKLEAKLK